MILHLNRVSQKNQNNKKSTSRSKCGKQKNYSASKINKIKKEQNWQGVIEDIDKLTNKIRIISNKSTSKHKRKNLNNISVNTGKNSIGKAMHEDQGSQRKKYKQKKNYQQNRGMKVSKSQNSMKNKSKNACNLTLCNYEQKMNYEPSCYLMHSQIEKLRKQKQRLQEDKIQLQKRLFFEEMQKKEMKKKIDQFRIQKTIKQYSKFDKQNLLLDLSTDDALSRNNRRPKIGRKHIQFKTNYDENSMTQEERLYKSIQLKPTPKNYQKPAQFSSQYATMGLKSVPSNQQYSTVKKKQRKILNLSSGRRTEQKKSRQEDRKIVDLQQYFDKLMQLSRLQRNRLKKKVVWNQMRDIAHQLKNLRQNL